MLKWILGVILSLFIIPSISIAADFYLYFQSCKIMVGYLVLSDESVKIVDGDGSLTACTRTSQSISCEFKPLGEGKGNRNSDEYKVIIDSPPLLIFSNTDRTDYYVIDLNQHAATLISRVVDPKFAGAKVCQGMYVTDSEHKMMEKSNKK